MQLELFPRPSEKAELQRALDRDRTERQTTILDEIDAPSPAAPEGGKPLFKRPRKTEIVFRVDLLGGWLQP